MWSIKTYGYLLSALSGIGTLTNLKSAHYIKKTFDTNKNVYYILLTESIINVCCNGLYFIANIIDLVNEDVLKNKFGCDFFCFGLIVPSLLGVLTTWIISLRRFLQLKYPMLLCENCRNFNIGINIGLGLCVSYSAAHILVTKNDFTEVCQGDKEIESTQDTVISLVSSL